MKDKIDYKKSWYILKECLEYECRTNKRLINEAKKENDFIGGLENKTCLSYGEWVLCEMKEIKNAGKLL